MKMKSSSIPAIISFVVIGIITIFDYSHYSVTNFIIAILPFLLFGILSFGILDLFDFETITKIILTAVLTIALVVAWFFLIAFIIHPISFP